MNDGFTQIPNDILYSPNLTEQARMLYMKIYGKCGKLKDGTDFYPWLSLQGVGELIGITKHKYIRRYVDELIDFGLLTTQSKQTNTGRPIQQYIPTKLTNELRLKLKQPIDKTNNEIKFQPKLENEDPTEAFVKNKDYFLTKLKQMREE